MGYSPQGCKEWDMTENTRYQSESHGILSVDERLRRVDWTGTGGAPGMGRSTRKGPGGRV